MSNVTKFTTAKPAENPDVVLGEAIGKFESVLIIGWDHDGLIDARASLNLDGANMLWLTEVFRSKLICGDYAPD